MKPATVSTYSGPATASRFGSELRARIVSAAVLGVVAVVVTYQGGWSFALLWLIAGSVIAVEWLAMARVGRFGTLAAIAILGLVGCCLGIVLRTPWWTAPAALAAAALALALASASQRDRLWSLAGLAAAAVIVVAMPLLRDQAAYGLAIVLWMFAVVWTTDIAAYFAGRRFGGPKLWPAISPKKTWSGSLAGLLAGTLAGVAVVTAAARWSGWPPPAGLALLASGSALASVAGQLGDLGESALKRHCGVKDSGRLIPGHGGVMDRLDALWAVALLGLLGLAGARLVQP